jgi:hypothetical protein
VANGGEAEFWKNAHLNRQSYAVGGFKRTTSYDCSGTIDIFTTIKKMHLPPEIDDVSSVNDGCCHVQ